MHEHGCLDFHIQNKNLYKTEQKKVNSAIWKKKVDYKNRTQEQILEHNSNCSPFKTILLDTSFIKIV
jgi:hypothetical protein